MKKADVVAGALSGILLGLSYSPAGTNLGWLALIPLAWQLGRSKNPGGAGTLTGLVSCGIAQHWVGDIENGPLLWMLSLWPGLLVGVWGWAYAQGRTEGEKILGGVSAWILLEALRASFPPWGWNPLATSTTWNAALALASWGGEAAVSGAILTTNLGAAAILRGKANAGIGALAATALFLALTEILTPKGSEPRVLKTSIIHTNYEEGGNKEEAWEALKEWTREAGQWDADLVIWPEALTKPLESAKREVKEMWKSEGDVIMTGLSAEGGRLKNRTTTLKGEGTYEKQFLAPVAEYLPEVGGVRSPLTPGKKGNEVLETPRAKVGVMICLEQSIPWTGRERAQAGADLLVAPSNTEEVGEWGGWQQNQSGRLRGIEAGLPIIICDNRGTSSVFSPTGIPIFQTKEAGAHNIPLELIKQDTPFTKTGNWLPWVAGATLAGIATRQKAGGKRKNRQGTQNNTE